MRHIADIRCPYASVPGSHKNTVIAHLKNNILNLVKKSALLLSLAPCMLLAKNKLEDPTNVPPTTSDHITDTRTHAPTSLVERLLAIDSLDERDFVEIEVESQGSLVNFNSDAKKFQVIDASLSTDKYAFVDPDNGDKTISSMTLNRQDNLKWNLHRGGSNIYEYNTEDDVYNQIGTRLDWDDAVKVGDSTYYGAYGNQLRSYKEGDGVKVLHALDPATEGDLRKIEADSAGNLYFYSLRRLSRSDRTHGLWKYNTTANTMEQLHTENNDELDYSGVTGLAVVGDDLYVCHGVVNNVAEPQKTVIMRYDHANRTYKMWKEIDVADTGGGTADDFVGFVNDDGLVRFAIQFLDWEKTMILKQTAPPVIANPIEKQTIAEDAHPLPTVDLTALTSNRADPKTVVRFAPGGIVAVSIVDNTLTITPMANQHTATSGDITVTLNVTNANNPNQTIQTSFEVAITSENDAPTVVALHDQTFDEDDTDQTINTDITDVDGDTPTVSVASSHANVTASIDGTHDIVLAFAENFNTENAGPVTITLTADDENGGVTQRTFGLTITAQNDAPGINSALADQTFDEDANGIEVTNPGFTDVEGDDLTYSVRSNHARVTASLNGNNNINLTFAENFNTAGGSAVQITLTADDGNGGVTDAIWGLTVSAVNDAPTVVALHDVTFDEDATDQTIDTDITDVDGDTPTVSVASSHANVTASIDGTHDIVLAFAENFNTENAGPVTITLTADDENGGVTQRTFGVTITAQNDAPSINSAIADQTFDEDANGIEVTNPGFTDIEGDDITYSVRSNHARVTASLNGNNNINLTFAENFNTAGGSAVQITLTADDGNGGVTDAVWGLTVSAVNDAPTVVALHDVTFDEDATDQTIGTDITDVDGDTPTVSVASSNTNVTASIDGTHDIVLAFAENFNTENAGPVTITLTADDENGGVTQRTFGVTITAQNDAPSINSAIADQTFDEDANGIEVTNPGFTDVEGDDITYSVRSNHASVTASLNGNNNINLAFTENFNTAGGSAVQITLTADDGNGGVTDAVIRVAITAVDDAVAWTGAIPPMTVHAGSPSQTVDLATLSTDVEGDAITYSVVSSSTADAIGTIDDSKLTVSFEGVGSATLTVTASANGTSDELDVSVAVNAFTRQVHITSFTAGDPLKTGQIFRVPTTFAGMEVPADYTIVEAGSNILERLSLDILNSEWVYEVKANPSLDEEVIVFQGPKENRLAITVAVADWTVAGPAGVLYTSPGDESTQISLTVPMNSGSTSRFSVAAFARNGTAPNDTLASKRVLSERTDFTIMNSSFDAHGIVNGTATGTELVISRNPVDADVAAVFGVSTTSALQLIYVKELNNTLTNVELMNGEIVLTIEVSMNVQVMGEVSSTNGTARVRFDHSTPGQVTGTISITDATDGSGVVTFGQKGFIGPMVERTAFAETEIPFMASNGTVSQVSEPLLTGIQNVLATGSLKNYANPFVNHTAIEYTLTKRGPVNISVYTSAGRLVSTLVDGDQHPGDYHITWEASNQPSGIYLLTFTNGNESAVERMVVK